MNQTQPKAVLFDLDGTLVDSLADLSNAMNVVLRQNGFAVHERCKYNYFVGNGIRKLVERALPEEERTEGRIHLFHHQMIDYYRAHCVDYTQPYDGITELLSALEANGMKMCVLSNKADELTQKIVGTLFGSWNFAVIRGAVPDVPIKPDPTSAISIADEVGVEPSDFLYLGDTDVDMRTAAAAGMFPIGCAWGFRTEGELKAAGAAVVINRPMDAMQFIKLKK